MKRTRRNHGATCKAQVALAAVSCYCPANGLVWYEGFMQLSMKEPCFV